jgi:hypothetical protein
MILSEYARLGYLNKLLNSELCHHENCYTSITVTIKSARHITLSILMNMEVDLEEDSSSFLYSKMYYCQSVLFK